MGSTGLTKEILMLSIQMGKVKNLAILDTSAGVSIATKSMWIKWGQLSATEKLKWSCSWLMVI